MGVPISLLWTLTWRGCKYISENTENKRGDLDFASHLALCRRPPLELPPALNWYSHGNGTAWCGWAEGGIFASLGCHNKIP